MASPRIIPLVLAGGAGTRLWPVSRDAMPKQFLPLVGEKSTYQQALMRVAAGDLFAPPIVMTSDAIPLLRAPPGRGDRRRRHRRAGADAARLRPRHRGRRGVRQEPRSRRDRACHRGRSRHPRHRAFPRGLPRRTRRGRGRDTSSPSASARPGRRRATATSAAARRSAFPARAGSRRSSRSPMPRPPPPMWRRAICGIRAISCFAPTRSWPSSRASSRRWRRRSKPRSRPPATTSASCAWTKRPFPRRPQKSIDYAVMEKTDRAAVVEGRFRWSDIGSWDAVFEVASRDQAGNATSGPALAVDATGCMVHAEGKLTAVLGAEDLIVVSTPDAVLVMPRSRAEEVKRAGRRAQAQGQGRRRSSIAAVHRPWGYYEFDRRRRALPGQAHRRPCRAASCRCRSITIAPSTGWWCAAPPRSRSATRCRVVHENESIYIPIGSVHRLANPGTHRARADRGADRQLSGRGRHRADRGRLSPRVSPSCPRVTPSLPPAPCIGKIVRAPRRGG